MIFTQKFQQWKRAKATSVRFYIIFKTFFFSYGFLFLLNIYAKTREKNIHLCCISKYIKSIEIHFEEWYEWTLFCSVLKCALIIISKFRGSHEFICGNDSMVFKLIFMIVGRINQIKFMMRIFRSRI